MLERLNEYRQRREREKQLRFRFTKVYSENIWGSGESRSGLGSQLDSASVTVARESLVKAVTENGVRSIADVPCGDFNWMPHVLATLGPVRYIGCDIVLSALTRNRDRYPQYEFRLLDLTSKVPPRVDLIFCKDLLNHLADDDVRAAIANIRRSGARFLLASNNPGWENTPLPDTPGASRHLDITAPPFNIAAPLWTLSGYMSLWRIADLSGRGT